MSNTVMVFKGKTDILSNFYEFPIYYNGMCFNCVEQAYQHAKAVMYERMDIATQLLHLKTGYQQWRCAKRIKVDERWGEARVYIMRDILVQKLHCQESYRNLLLQTDAFIVEAVPGDKFWSCGLTKEEALRRNPSTYPGKNIMGQLHMEVREIAKQRERVEADFRAAALALAGCEEVTFINIGVGNQLEIFTTNESLVCERLQGVVSEAYSVKQPWQLVK